MAPRHRYGEPEGKPSWTQRNLSNPSKWNSLVESRLDGFPMAENLAGQKV